MKWVLDFDCWSTGGVVSEIHGSLRVKSGDSRCCSTHTYAGRRCAVPYGLFFGLLANLRSWPCLPEIESPLEIGGNSVFTEKNRAG